MNYLFYVSIGFNVLFITFLMFRIFLYIKDGLHKNVKTDTEWQLGVDNWIVDQDNNPICRMVNNDSITRNTALILKYKKLGILQDSRAVMYERALVNYGDVIKGVLDTCANCVNKDCHACKNYISIANSYKTGNEMLEGAEEYTERIDAEYSSKF